MIVRLSALLGVMLLAGHAPGAPLFRKPLPIEHGGMLINAFAPGALASADFNGDGFPDVATGYTNGRLVIALTDGSGPFAASKISTFSMSIWRLAPGDMNHDGKQDLVYSGGQFVGVLLGNGDGTFALGPAAVFTGNGDLGIGDFNGDGHLDAALVRNDALTPEILINLGNGLGGFGAAVHNAISLPDVIWDEIVIANLNGDAKADVLIAGRQSAMVFLSGAAGALTHTWTTSGGKIAVGRLNAGATPDLIVQRTSWDYALTVSTYLGQGNGSFALHSTQAAAIGGRVGCLDFNGDGIDDVLTGGGVSFLRGLGTGALAAPLPTSLISSADAEFVVGDFDRDGWKDLVTVGAAWAPQFNRGNGDGTFYGDRGYIARESPVSSVGVSALDMNADGLPDATSLVSNQTGTWDIAVLRNDGHGGLRTAVFTPTPASTGGASSRFVVGSLNGDSWPDALVLSASTARSFLGNGNATFSAGPTTAVTMPVDPYEIPKLADVTGDGQVDLLIEGNLYEGNGDGSFDAARVTGAQYHLVGDVDGNGTLDAVWRGQTQLAVALNTGGGNFAAPAFFGPGDEAPEQLGDFDNDGKLDLFCISGEAIVYRGHGDGTFGNRVETVVATYPVHAPVWPETADFDGDGKLDIAIDGVVLLGNGDGRFRSLEPGFGNTQIAIANFDGAGGPDVLVFSGSHASLLLTKLVPEGTQGSVTTLTASASPQHAVPVTYTALTSGLIVPASGSFVFTLDGLPAVLSDSRYGTSTAFTLPAGPHTLTASFLGSATYLPSSATMTLNVDRATTSLDVDPYSPIYGERILLLTELTAPIATGMPQPSTTAYTVREDGNLLTDIQLGTNSISVCCLEVGSHTLTVEFTGDDYYKPSEKTVTLNMEKRQPSTSTSYSPTSRNLIAGGSVTVKFKIEPTTYGTPTGTVAFLYDGQPAGSVPVIGNEAALTIPDLTVGNHTVSMTYSGDGNYKTASDSEYFFVYAPPGNPVSVTATASSSSFVKLRWTLAADAYGYRVYGKNFFTAGWSNLSGPVSGPEIGVFAFSGQARLYCVAKILQDGSIGPLGPPDLAVALVFDNPQMIPGVPIRATHVTQLRSAVKAVRQFAGLPAFAFTDTDLAGAPVRALHLTELRDALSEARTAIGMPMTFSSPGPVANAPIRASHIEELRAGVR